MNKDHEKLWKPAWFDFTMIDNKVINYKYNGKYWKHHDERNWPKDLLDLFD